MNVRPVIIFAVLATVGMLVYKGFDHQLNKEGYKYSSLEQKGELKVLVLDAGHGGFDHGCSGKHSKEKHINLALIKKLKAKIQKKYPSLKIVMTRDSDVFIPLDQRAKVSNKSNADLFISIHCNYYKKNDVHGTETFVRRSPTSPTYSNLDADDTYAAILNERKYEREISSYNSENLKEQTANLQANIQNSLSFANMIEKNFVKNTNRYSRGVKHANFYVLKNTWMPGVLIESGFLSNEKEEKELSSESGQNAVVKSIFDAFVKYKEKVEGDKQIDLESLTDNKQANKPTKEEVVVPQEIEQEEERKLIEREEKADQAYRDEVVANSMKQTTISKPATPTNGVLFKIQLGVLSKKVDVNSGKWANLGNVEVVPAGSLFKYQTKGSGNYQDALSIKDKAKQLGFNGAFVVAYKEGQKISLPKALELSN